MRGVHLSSSTLAIVSGRTHIGKEGQFFMYDLWYSKISNTLFACWIFSSLYRNVYSPNVKYFQKWTFNYLSCFAGMLDIIILDRLAKILLIILKYFDIRMDEIVELFGDRLIENCEYKVLGWFIMTLFHFWDSVVDSLLIFFLWGRLPCRSAPVILYRIFQRNL